MRPEERPPNTKIVANVVVGEPEVKPTVSSHVPGIRQGNRPYGALRERDHDEEILAQDRARRSTGIRAKKHSTINPRMPKLPPP